MPIIKNSTFKVLLPLVLATGGFSGCAVAEPSAPSLTAPGESRHITAATPQPPQTLREMFGNPDQWEMHIYTFPLNIETIKPLKPEDLRKKSHKVGHQHITDGNIIKNSIAAIKDIEFSERPYSLIYARVLIEFKHKHKDEIIALSNDGETSVFYIEKIAKGQTKQFPPIVIHDMEKYKTLRELFKNIY